MAYYVQVYRSTDLNSPPITGQAGGLLSCLNPCLVDGYGWSGMSISSLTRAGAVATATVSAADGLKLKTGMILTISGVTGPGGGDPALYNGTFTITVASTTTFTYTMSGTPSGTATGTIVVSSWLPITSITRGGAGNLTATLTMNNQNVTLITGNYFTIAGCTGTGNAQYNGTFRITVTSSTTFTYQMVSDPGASASGSPVYAKAGLQWTRPFSAGTNSQTYQSATTVGALGEVYTPYPLQIIDNAVVTGLQCEVYGAEILQSDQVITLGQFPTTAQRSGGGQVKKAVTANTVVRDWTLWGDEKTFTLGIISGAFAGNHDGCLSFGYFIPTKTGDAFNTLVFCNSGTASNNYAQSFCANQFCASGHAVSVSGFAPRAYYQFGSSTLINQTLLHCTISSPGSLGAAQTAFITFPSPTDFGYYVQPVFITDTVGVLRGRMPGIYSSLMAASSYPILNNGDVLTNVVGMSGITLASISTTHLSTVGQVLVDAFGPWI